MNAREAFEDLRSKIKSIEEILNRIDKCSIDRGRFNIFLNGISESSRSLSESVEGISKDLSQEISNSETVLNACLKKKVEVLQNEFSDIEKKCKNIMDDVFKKLAADLRQKVEEIQNRLTEFGINMEKEKINNQQKIESLQKQSSRQQVLISNLEEESALKRLQLDEAKAFSKLIQNQFACIETAFEEAVVSYKSKIKELEQKLKKMESGAEFQDHSSVERLQSCTTVKEMAQYETLERSEEENDSKDEEEQEAHLGSATPFDEEIRLLQETFDEEEEAKREKLSERMKNRRAVRQMVETQQLLEMKEEELVEREKKDAIIEKKATTYLIQDIVNLSETAVTTAMTTIPQDVDLFEDVRNKTGAIKDHLTNFYTNSMVTVEMFDMLSLEMAKLKTSIHEFLQEKNAFLKQKLVQTTGNLQASFQSAFDTLSITASQIKDGICSKLEDNVKVLTTIIQENFTGIKQTLAGHLLLQKENSKLRNKITVLQQAIAAQQARMAELRTETAIYEEQAKDFRMLEEMLNQGFDRLRRCSMLQPPTA